MKFTQTVNSKKCRENFLDSAQKRAIVFNLGYFILGIFMSKGIIFDEYMPFGASLIAAVPYKNLFSALLGTILGYFLPSEVNISVRYMVVAISISLIRWTLNDLKKLKNNLFYAPIIAATAVLMTGMVVNNSGSVIHDIFSYTTVEAIFAGVFAYFFKETTYILNKKQNLFVLTHQEMVCAFVSLWTLILSLSSVAVKFISIGKILAAIVILLCSRYLGLAGGSVAGIAATIVFSLSSQTPSFIYGFYSFGGLLAGLASRFGKYIQAVTFLVVSLIVSVQTGNNYIIFSNLYEVLFAIIIFIALPNKFENLFVGLFYSPTKDFKEQIFQDDVSKRLQLASDALFNIGNSVNEVSKKLVKTETKNITEFSGKVKDEVCRTCCLKPLCWETRITETLGAFDDIKSVMSKEKQLTNENMPKVLSNRCCKINDVNNFVNSLYRENQIRNTSQKRILEVKSFISEQFSDMSKILEDLSQEYKKGDTFDSKMAQRIKVKLRSLGLIGAEVICKYDMFNRLSIEIETSCQDKMFLEQLNLNKVLENVCYRSLDVPCINFINDIYKINISEKASFSVDIGASQHVCAGESLCGDNYTYFNDGKGRFIIILSDGMGTGSRAAIEGAMACEIVSSLIKSGIGFETAIKVTNSCLFVKSEDESFATLDIICLDLFTGVVDIIKAGSPITLVQKNSELLTLDLPSLPVGILKSINFTNKKEILSSGDKILIISDGVIHPDEFWIQSEVENWKEANSKEFAEHIVKSAVANRNGCCDDDITAIAIKII